MERSLEGTFMLSTELFCTEHSSTSRNYSLFTGAIVKL